MPGTVLSTVGKAVVNETLLTSRGPSYDSGGNLNAEHLMLSSGFLRIFGFFSYLHEIRLFQ